MKRESCKTQTASLNWLQLLSKTKVLYQSMFQTVKTIAYQITVTQTMFVPTLVSTPTHTGKLLLVFIIFILNLGQMGRHHLFVLSRKFPL